MAHLKAAGCTASRSYWFDRALTAGGVRGQTRVGGIKSKGTSFAEFTGRNRDMLDVKVRLQLDA